MNPDHKLMAQQLLAEVRLETEASLEAEAGSAHTEPGIDDSHGNVRQSPMVENRIEQVLEEMASRLMSVPCAREYLNISTGAASHLFRTMVDRGLVKPGARIRKRRMYQLVSTEFEELTLGENGKLILAVMYRANKPISIPMLAAKTGLGSSLMHYWLNTVLIPARHVERVGRIAKSDRQVYYRLAD